MNEVVEMKDVADKSVPAQPTETVDPGKVKATHYALPAEIFEEVFSLVTKLPYERVSVLMDKVKQTLLPVNAATNQQV